MKTTSAFLLFASMFLFGCATKKKVNWETLAFDTSYNHQEIQSIAIDEDELVFSLDVELAIIEVRLSDFVENLNEFHLQQPRITDDSELLSIVVASRKNISSEELSNKLQQRALFRIEDLLAEGKARVFNRNENKYVGSYMTGYFSYQFDPLFGGGGMIFFFTGTQTVFLEVQEWIS